MAWDAMLVMSLLWNVNPLLALVGPTSFPVDVLRLPSIPSHVTPYRDDAPPPPPPPVYIVAILSAICSGVIVPDTPFALIASAMSENTSVNVVSLIGCCDLYVV